MWVSGGESTGQDSSMGGTAWAVLGVACPVGWPWPCPWLPPLLPQPLSLHPTNPPPFSPAKEMHGGSGVRSSDSMARSRLGSESQGPQVSLPRGVHEGPGPNSPRGLNAFNLTAISIPRDSFLGQRPGVIVLPSSYALSSIFTYSSVQQSACL